MAISNELHTSVPAYRPTYFENKTTYVGVDFFEKFVNSKKFCPKKFSGTFFSHSCCGFVQPHAKFPYH